MARRRPRTELSKSTRENQERLVELLGASPDLTLRLVRIGPRGRIGVLLVAIAGLYDSAFVSEQVVAPIVACGRRDGLTRTSAVSMIEGALVTASEVRTVQTLNEIIDEVLAGNTAVLVDGAERALIVSSAAPPSRSVEEPDSEAIVRGPKVGFNEVLQTTSALIRQ